MIGKTLSHYKIIEKIGEGGMGVVYKAEDTKLGRFVAIKFLPGHIAANEENRKRFEIEAKAAAALNHPNLATIHTVEEVDGESFIVMEYIEGQELKEIVVANGGSPLSLETILEYAVQIAEGLQAAHEKAVIHRDIKSANIMITEKAQVKIMDFGLAKVRGATQLTKEHSTLGTVSYMSPEQALGEDTDHRTDIWSFGVVLYEMLTGELPFRSEYEHAIMYYIVNEEPTPFKNLKRAVPTSLGCVTEKCLKKKPEQRYQNFKELSADLKTVEQEITHEIKANSTYKFKTRGQHYYYRVIIALLLLIISFGLYMWQRDEVETTQVSIAVLPFKSITNDTDQDWVAESMTDVLTTELAKIGGLRVISQSSSMQYKDNPKPIPEIARELQVEYVVDPSVLVVGNEVRISARLINAPKDEYLWGENFQRNLSNIFVLQGEIASEIASQVRVKLTPQENERLASARKVNPDAYLAYVRGRSHYSKHSSEGYLKSIEYFNQAVRIDSGLAMAYAGLGDVYSKVSIGGFIPSLSQEEALLRAGIAVNKAIELDSTLAEAYTARAHLRMRKWDWVGSERDFQRAIKMNPNYSWAYHFYAALLEWQGRYAEAIVNRKRAAKLDPLNVAMNAYMAAPYIYSGEHDKAISILEQVRELHPNEAIVYHILALPYVGKGMYAKAIELWQEFFRLYGSRPGPVYSQMAEAYVLAGKQEEAVQILHELIDRSKREDGLLASIAGIYLNLGETDKVFEWWEKAYQKRESGLKGWLRGPATDSLRSDPRFESLLKRLGLPEKL